MNNIKQITYENKPSENNIFVADGDLLDLFEKDEINIFAHGCNCLNKMGNGIAKTIKSKYPQMYAADTKMHNKCGTKKLGDLSYFVFNKTKPKIGFNLYSQFNYWYDKEKKKEPFDADALVSAMEKMHKLITEFNTEGKVIKLGFPRIGSGLAGGNQDEIQEMIYDEFKSDKLIHVYIIDFVETK